MAHHQHTHAHELVDGRAHGHAAYAKEPDQLVFPGDAFAALPLAGEDEALHLLKHLVAHVDALHFFNAHRIHLLKTLAVPSIL